jgi:CRP-like cAMP-binding protein
MMAPAKSAKNSRLLASKRVLAGIGKNAKAVAFLKKQAIFTQGDGDGAVFYIQEGKVKLTVTSSFGKQATLNILNNGAFIGDDGLAGQPLRMQSATAMTDCKLLQINKKAMMLALHKNPTLFDLFVMHLVARNIRYHEALVDQLFDPSEKRLARILLVHAHFGEKDAPATVIPKVSHEALAKMADTRLPRVDSLMKKFIKSGFLAYGENGLQIHSSLVCVVLRS